MRCIDLTHLISREMPVYPGTEPPRLQPANTYDRDGFQETLLTMYSHTGTHMDPPAHLFAGRTTLDRFPVEQFIGRALVIHCPELREGERLGDRALFRRLSLYRFGHRGLPAPKRKKGRGIGHHRGGSYCGRPSEHPPALIPGP